MQILLSHFCNSEHVYQLMLMYIEKIWIMYITIHIIMRVKCRNRSITLCKNVIYIEHP